MDTDKQTDLKSETVMFWIHFHLSLKDTTTTVACVLSVAAFSRQQSDKCPGGVNEDEKWSLKWPRKH